MIKAIEGTSVHRITSGQVIIDLQTAVKELVENSLDSGATSIEVRLKDYGLRSIEVIDNGSGIAPEDYDNVALKHHTSKLQTFEDLSTVRTFGFRGEALSSLCALCKHVTITTATSSEAPMGTVLEMDPNGKVKSRSGKVARQRGTTVTVDGLFTPLPVRRKEFERNSKLQLGKALNLLSAYALVPCTKENKGVRLSVFHQPDGGKKTLQIRTDGNPSIKSSISSLWGPKQLENLVELNLHVQVFPEKAMLKRQGNTDTNISTKVEVRGLISKFSPGHGRTGTDRQFFFINGRPCNPSKIQKAFNEVYRTFNTNQSPFIAADFILPTNTCDINVSPDKRTILLHSENNLVAALKVNLEETFSSSRSTFTVQATQQSKGNKTAKKQYAVVDKSDEGMGNPILLQEPVIATRSEDDQNENTREENQAGNEAIQASAISETTESSESQDTSTGSIPSQLSEGSLSTADSIIVDQPIRKSVRENSEDVSKGTNRYNSKPSGSPTVTQIQMPVSRQGSVIPVNVAMPQNNGVELDVDNDTMSISTPPPPKTPQHLVVIEESTSDSLTDRNEAPSSPQPPKSRSAISKRLLSNEAPPAVQLVLSTSNASWNLQKTSSSSAHAASSSARGEPPRKKARFGQRGGLEMMRAQLAGFANGGDRGILKRDARGDAEDDAEMDELESDDSQRDNALDNDVEGDVQPEASGQKPTRKAQSDASGGTRSQERSTSLSPHEPLDVQSLDIDMGDSEVSAEPTSSLADLDSNPEANYSPSPSHADHKELVRTVTSDQDDVCFHVNIIRISAQWTHLHRLQVALKSTGGSATGNSKGLPATGLGPNAGVTNTDDDEGAKRELARVIHKEDFSSMEVMGQFNLGFIIARKRTGPISTRETDGNTYDEVGASDCGRGVLMDDLFIIDQHAADEKYNFETLQQMTKIESQKLYSPRPLELTAADELLALENIDILRSNGFEIAADENVESGQRGRVNLLAQPVSGSTNFDMNDLEELVHLMRERPVGQMVRCSKARAMFAMRACRKSIMVGRALTLRQMTSVVRHMGTMHQPWNCPHGRPTMRHLVSLIETSARIGADEVLDNDNVRSRASRTINWSNL